MNGQHGEGREVSDHKERVFSEVVVFDKEKRREKIGV